MEFKTKTNTYCGIAGFRLLTFVTVTYSYKLCQKTKNYSEVGKSF